MSISNRERFLGICHFERPGDLYISDLFWLDTLEEWAKQGAPKELSPDANSFKELFDDSVQGSYGNTSILQKHHL